MNMFSLSALLSLPPYSNWEQQDNYHKTAQCDLDIALNKYNTDAVVRGMGNRLLEPQHMVMNTKMHCHYLGNGESEFKTQINYTMTGVLKTDSGVQNIQYLPVNDECLFLLSTKHWVK